MLSSIYKTVGEIKLKRFIYLLVLTACSSSGQNNSKMEKSSLSDDQLISRYLENGAWRVRYFSPEYQLYIDSAIAINPKMAYLYQQKSMPYFKQGKYEMGLEILDKAVELDAKSHIDYRAFIKCIFAKQYKNAIADFIESKKIKGEHGNVMDHSYDFYIGLSYLQLNNFETALKYLEDSMQQTKKVSGENWVHHLELLYAGIANQELNRQQEAIGYFDRALKSYPSFSDAKYYKSISLFRTNQFELAEATLDDCEADFKRGLTINEDNAAYVEYPYQIKQFYIDALRMVRK